MLYAIWAAPVSPFNLLNYAFELTKIKLKQYFFASWLDMMPGTIMYVYIGSQATRISVEESKQAIKMAELNRNTSRKSQSSLLIEQVNPFQAIHILQKPR